MAEREQDLTEQATPFKLREAHRRGQVAKSAELTAWFLMLSVSVFVYAFGAKLIQNGLVLSSGLFSQSSHVPLSVRNTVHLFSASVFWIVSAFGFLIVAIVGVALLSMLAQIGPVFSFTPLKPDFSRINPVSGFKKLFNQRILFEALKTLLKFSIVLAVIALFVRREISSLMRLMQLEVNIHPAVIIDAAVRLAFWLLLALAAIVLLDMLFVKWDFARNMRMSRREVKEEVKRREGDPKIKAKIRELQREAAARGASLQKVADADVLITNPTHLSVALRYEKGLMPAPIVVAKGAGELAMRMRIKARQCGVPLVENKSLARTLFRQVGLEQPIVPEVYPQVAKILTQVYQTRTAR